MLRTARKSQAIAQNPRGRRRSNGLVLSDRIGLHQIHPLEAKHMELGNENL